MALLTVMCGLAVSGIAPTSLAAAPAMRANFTWTGEGANDNFDDHCNWHPTATWSLTDPVPDDTGDNATFPAQLAGAWTVDLVTEEIGDLTIEECVDFDTAGGTVTLDVQKLEIDAAAGEITLTIGESAKITITNP